MQNNLNTVLLNGIGGMGKSELLNKWVHAVAHGDVALNYDNIVYISCTNGIANAFENNAKESQALGIQADDPNKLETAKLALSQLDNLLLVLDDLPWEEQLYKDNINHVNDLRALTPHVIATSRRTYTNFEKVSVPALDDEQAIALFKNHFEPNVTQTCDDAIKQIIKRAGKHTLTIEILSKTASENNWSATELLETLEANNFDYETLDTDVEYTKSGKHAEETLHNALEKIFDLSNLTDAQKEILFHLSCMDSQPFNIEAVKNWLDVKVPDIKKLVKLGWIQQSQQINDVQLYQLHQTITYSVKAVFENSMSAYKRVTLMQAVVKKIEDFFSLHDITNDSNILLPAIRSYLNDLLIYGENESDEIKLFNIDKIHWLCLHAIKHGQFSFGVDLIEGKTLSNIKKQLGKKHENYACSLVNLAGMYHGLCEYEKALDLYIEAEEILGEKLGERHHLYASCINNMGELQRDWGNYEQAIILFKKVIAIRKEVLGPKHNEYATSLNNLALVYEHQGLYSESLALHIESLDIVAKTLGKNSLNYSISLQNIAMIYYRLGDYEKSLKINKQAIEIIKIKETEYRYFNPAVFSNIAMTLLALKKHEEALSYAFEAKQIVENNLSINHPSYSHSIQCIAAIYNAMGKIDDTVSLFKHSLEVIKRTVGKNHPLYANSANNLGYIYCFHKQEYELALILFNEALQVRRTQLGENHPTYATTLNNLAGLYRSMGESEKALPLYEQAIHIFQQALGKEHPNTKTVIGSYAQCKRELGK